MIVIGEAGEWVPARMPALASEAAAEGEEAGEEVCGDSRYTRNTPQDCCRSPPLQLIIMRAFFMYASVCIEATRHLSDIFQSMLTLIASQATCQAHVSPRQNVKHGLPARELC